VIDSQALHRKLKELLKISGSEPHIIVLLSGYFDREPNDLKALLRYGDALREVGRQREAVGVLARLSS